MDLNIYDKCCVSGEGAVVLSQCFVKTQKKDKRQHILMKTDESFSVDHALSVLVSTINDQNATTNGNHLVISGSSVILTT